MHLRILRTDSTANLTNLKLLDMPRGEISLSLGTPVRGAETISRKGLEQEGS